MDATTEHDNIRWVTIDDLPDEVLLFIFSRFVDPGALFRISHVCSRWRKLSAHRLLAPNRVQIMTSLSSSSNSSSSSVNSPFRRSFNSKSPLPLISSSPNAISSPVLQLSSSAPSSPMLLTNNATTSTVRQSQQATLRSPSSSFSSAPLRSSSMTLMSPKDFNVIAQPSTLPRRTFTTTLPSDKEVVDTFKLQMTPNSEVVCRSCLMLQPLLSKAEKREYGSAIRNKPIRSFVFRIQILKFQVLKFSEDSVHCGCYFVEKSKPKRQLYCRFSCVTGLNSIDCELGKECGAKVIGREFDDDDEDDASRTTRPWDRITLAITSIDLQGEDVCEVVFCLLDDKDRVARINREIQQDKAAERQSNVSSTSTTNTATITTTTTPPLDDCIGISDQENTPPNTAIAAEVPQKFTIQNFLRELLFPRKSSTQTTANRKTPTIVISPSSPPIPIREVHQANSIQSPSVCFTTVNTKCCVLPFMGSSSSS
eukprot:TRINITY_DN9376_c0_g1_i1.p1 TRINITY_DN9376_c0_g1~~TRINITY_DN9376_c0_g1_i1.p1  ORF type:complete len:481 (-),score=104.31 TRINITY_DN9376_c0_g1_i1:66-1508(-)